MANGIWLVVRGRGTGKVGRWLGGQVGRGSVDRGTRDRLAGGRWIGRVTEEWR